MGREEDVRRWTSSLTYVCILYILSNQATSQPRHTKLRFSMQRWFVVPTWINESQTDISSASDQKRSFSKRWHANRNSRCKLKRLLLFHTRPCMGGQWEGTGKGLKDIEWGFSLAHWHTPLKFTIVKPSHFTAQTHQAAFFNAAMVRSPNVDKRKSDRYFISVWSKEKLLKKMTCKSKQQMQIETASAFPHKARSPKEIDNQKMSHWLWEPKD